MIDSSLQRKEFVSGLIEVLSLGIAHQCLDDAETLLVCVRSLRPRMAELDTFEAWIAMKRGFWKDAIRLLHNVDASTSNWSLGKALLAFCQYATGDAGWSISAHDVLQNGQNPEAINLVKLLLDPKEAMSPANPEPASTSSTLSSPTLMQNSYLRA
jgi:type III secretion protein HrpB1